jgi:FKBP-type peptidyl-prolyl cis-trans isomerase
MFSEYMSQMKAKEAEVKAKAGKDFLEANKKKPGIITTASGLQYEVMTKGPGGAKPKATDKVKVHYHGTMIDGTIFDSSVQRGEPISFGLNQVIKGWTEGLQLMEIGDKFRFYLPFDLAYGDRGAGPVIGPYSTLIFEVELLGINE